jgi:hypothetical protein
LESVPSRWLVSVGNCRVPDSILDLRNI